MKNFFKNILSTVDIFIDLSKYKWYRKLQGGTWYLHKNNHILPEVTFDTQWTTYKEINKFTTVLKEENYNYGKE